MEDNELNKQNDLANQEQNTNSTEQDLLNQIEGKKTEPMFGPQTEQQEPTTEPQTGEQSGNVENTQDEVAPPQTGPLATHETEDDGRIHDDRFEKQCYSQKEYERIAKIRTRGKMYRAVVPYLQYPLTPPEKKRTSFTILAYLFAILAGVAAVFSAIFFAAAVMPTLIIALQGITQEPSDITKALDVLGIVQALQGFGVGLAVLYAIAVTGVLVGLVYYIAHQSYLLFYLAKANREEVAKGPRMVQLLMSASVWFAAVLGTVIYMLIRLDAGKIVSSPAFYVLIALVLAFGAILAVVAAQMIKENKFFKTLPEDQQKTYLEHSRKVRRAKEKHERAEKHSHDIATQSSTSSKNFNLLVLLLNIISKIADDTMLYKNIKETPDLKAISNHFGKKAISHSLMFLIFGGIAVFLLNRVFAGIGVILTIIAVIIAIPLAIYAIIYFFFTLAYVIKQLKLNRTAIGWIALVVFILATILLGFFTFATITNM